MIIKYKLVKLFIVFLLIALLPLAQKQWLNLYLFDTNKFTIYKFLYYLSGIICPLIVVFYSLDKFTYYKFDRKKINKNFDIRGKTLLFAVSTVLITLSFLISYQVFISLKLFSNLLINDNKFLVYFDINKQVLFSVILSILLLFNKFKLIIKKVILINYFIVSVIIWYSEVNKIIIIDLFNVDILNFLNINFVSLFFLIFIELIYYLWSYISYGSHLSDWIVPLPFMYEIKRILNILFFYLIIMIYYSMVIPTK